MNMFYFKLQDVLFYSSSRRQQSRSSAISASDTGEEDAGGLPVSVCACGSFEAGDFSDSDKKLKTRRW